jgi:hypothetical protein
MKKIIAIVLLCMPIAAHAEKRDRTLAEMEASIASKAARLDANADGILSESETRQGREKLGMFSSAITRRIDANADGIITKQEYIQAQVNEARAADLNSDGIVTVDEQKRQQRKLIGQLLGG